MDAPEARGDPSAILGVEDKNKTNEDQAIQSPKKTKNKKKTKTEKTEDQELIILYIISVPCFFVLVPKINPF